MPGCWNAAPCQNFFVVLLHNIQNSCSERRDNRPGHGAAKILQVIGVCAVGLNHVDTETAKAKGIQVFNAPGMNANAVAELTLAKMLEMSHIIRNLEQFVHAHAGSALFFEILGLEERIVSNNVHLECASQLTELLS